MKKIFVYIILPVFCFVILVATIYFFQEDFNKSVSISSDLTQALAIIIGGLWAYYKFGWEKKCENIITLKAALMEYTLKHNLSAAQFHIDSDVSQYKLSLLNDYHKLNQKIHLSYYVPKKLRNRILNIIWLTIGNNAGKNYEDITQNWEKYERKISDVYIEFDSIINF